MGKVAIVLVVGTAIILGIFGRAMITRSRDATKGSYSYYTKTAANNVAESAIEIYVNKLRITPSLATGSYNETLLGGTAKVMLANGTPSSSRVLTSIGVYQSAADTIKVYCDSASAGTLPVNAAIAYSKGASGGSWMFNDSQIDGRNYNYATGALDGSQPSMRGFTKENNNISTTFNNGGVTGSGGGPLPRDTASLGVGQIDFNSLPNQLYPLRNRLLSTSQNLASATWGTHASPEVTFITNTIIVNGACSGEGVLVIAGPFTCNSTFSWKGLVIFSTKDASWAGATNSSFAVITAGATVYGAMINVGDNVSYTANTSSNTFRYSKGIIDYVCAAVGLGSAGGSNTKYIVSRWYD